MTGYAYRVLPPTLHATADAAIAWFIKEYGLKPSRIGVEVPPAKEINFCPTFVAPLNDGHILCVELSESIHSNTLDSFSLDCIGRGLPVKLFVAVPKDLRDAEFQSKLRALKRAGMGLVEIGQHSGLIVQSALSLSLVAVRPLGIDSFPRRYRQALHHAHQTFTDGEPAKACALVYDELEAAFRRFARKCVAKGLWSNASGLNLEKAAWANVISEVDKHLDRSSDLVKKVTPALMARILGVTPHRNETGHKPRTPTALIERDRALRTRFEGALDLLEDFLGAVARLHV